MMFDVRLKLNSLTSPSELFVPSSSPKPTTDVLLMVRLETPMPLMPSCAPPEPPLPLTLR